MPVELALQQHLVHAREKPQVAVDLKHRSVCGNEAASDFLGFLVFPGIWSLAYEAKIPQCGTRQGREYRGAADGQNDEGGAFKTRTPTLFYLCSTLNNENISGNFVA